MSKGQVISASSFAPLTIYSQRVKVACKLRDEFGVVQKAKQGNLQFKQPELLTNGAPQMLLEGPKHDVQIAGITAPVDSKELPKLCMLFQRSCAFHFGYSYTAAGASISTIIESLDPAEKKLYVLLLRRLPLSPRSSTLNENK